MPTVQGTDDFDHAIDTSFYDAVFGAPVAVASPLYQSQPRSLEVVSAGSNIGVRKNYSGSPARGWLAAPLRVASALPADDVVVASFLSGTGTVARLVVATVGLYPFVSGQTQPEVAIDPDEFNWVEAIFDVSGTTHALHWALNGVTQTPATLTGQVASSVVYNQLVSLSGNAALTWHAGLWKWGSAASSSDWLGEPAAPAGVTADFRLPWEIEGPGIAETLGELPTSALVQRVYADLGRFPASDDDASAGFGPGDVWIHGSSAWWCISAAEGAAVWKQVA